MVSRVTFLICFHLACFFYCPAQHDVFFCGERIPVENEFVADKLMNVIRRQVPLVNLPSLRERAELYFPTVEKYLRMFGIPQDLKYLPIVESGFVEKARSRVGAYGFWQIMPGTAKDLGLVIDTATGRDDRTDINKASEGGCKHLKTLYNGIKKRFNVGSWSLAAAAYNTGGGNMAKNITKQGNDYFTMQLNPETAVYVYKIIAVKELFEYPEIYMSKFGYNVFTSTSSRKMKSGGNDNDEEFQTLTVDVGIKKAFTEKTKTPKYIAAHIEGKYKKFKDGKLVKIILDEDLTTSFGFSRKGYSFSVQGWIIEDRVFFDLGYGHGVTLYDTDLKKGINVHDLKKKKHFNVLLRNIDYDDEK